MVKKSDKPKAPKHWDRTPWPTSGDESQDVTYTSVGQALSEWERYESDLSFLFANFLGGAVLRGAMRSYNAVRTFQGRCDLLRAASESYFDGYHPKADFLLDDFKTILASANKFAERRNEIAHGVVDIFRQSPRDSQNITSIETYAIYPSYSTFKERDLDSIPTYCYTSKELDYFCDEFRKLRAPVLALAANLVIVVSMARLET
ncbi:MAG: hypothetical protein WC816_06690 [Sphingomonas sp.]|jgi:hypothetical protein